MLPAPTKDQQAKTASSKEDFDFASGLEFRKIPHMYFLQKSRMKIGERIAIRTFATLPNPREDAGIIFGGGTPNSTGGGTKADKTLNHICIYSAAGEIFGKVRLRQIFM